MGAEKDNLVSGGAEQVFKSTEIYKSESQKGGDVFEKKKTKKEKFLGWAEEHKKLCVLIVAGVVAILAIIVVLIVLLVNSGTQETSKDVVLEEEQVVEESINITTSVAGGDFFYTNCGDEELVSSIEVVKIRACVAAATDQSIATYIKQSLIEINQLKSDTAKATAYGDLLAVMSTYEKNLQQSGEEAPTELLQKMVEIAKRQDEILQTEISAMATYYYAEMAGDSETQEEYAQIYSERSDGVDINNREEREGVSG